MGLFGKKLSTKTVLMLDIENGSVGSALARVVQGEAPQVFGAHRVAVPVMDTRSAASLARAVEHASSDALLHASETAARLRNHGGTRIYIDKVVIFLAAPWGTPNLELGRPDFAQSLTGALAPRIEALFGPVPVSHHAHLSAALQGLRALYPHDTNVLLLSVNGEVSELLLLNDALASGHATAPIGHNSVVRTLRTHAGLSEHEALSLLRLGKSHEALSVAAEHFASEFKQAAQALGAGGRDVFILAHEPYAPWFAQALSHSSLAELYPQGGVVRTLRGHHFAPFVSTAGSPDAHLLMNALYTSGIHR